MKSLLRPELVFSCFKARTVVLMKMIKAANDSMWPLRAVRSFRRGGWRFPDVKPILIWCHHPIPSHTMLSSPKCVKRFFATVRSFWSWAFKLSSSSKARLAWSTPTVTLRSNFITTNGSILWTKCKYNGAPPQSPWDSEAEAIFSPPS